ncbi:MAG: methylmalonyl-CoA epimerase, partial [Candidatus Marinimicrobia bacterium]|nr:methylmalonyl-CoA epimerase [Candidatus Neomarinimicrobiota bacterium]
NILNAINELKNAGIDFINEEPSIGAENCMIAFVHPKSTGGILFELCQHQ